MHYGTPVELLAKYLAKQVDQSEDASVDLLIHLALAYAAAVRLQDKGANLTLKGKGILLSTLKRVYREAQYVRAHLPAEWLDVSFISRFGRVHLESKDETVSHKRHIRNPYAGHQHPKRSAAER